MNGWKKVSFILGVLALGLATYFSSFDTQNNESLAYEHIQSITIITVTTDNSLLPSAEYSIKPNPFEKTGTYIIKDNSVQDSDKKDGVISITGVADGNYTIIEVTPPLGYEVDRLPKIVEVKDPKDGAASFTNAPVGSGSVENTIKDITYTAKFVCGSVFGSEGPLRPGHYDSDISIFNKQDFPITILWNVVINDGASSNSILKNLDEETATAIVCKQIRDLVGFGNNNEKLVEGFVIIRIQLDSMVGTEDGKILRNVSEDEINLLDVQVFYTANALPTLPHEVIVDKISFYIIQDGSGMIPKEMIRKPLDVSIPSQLNEISNTEIRIKSILAEKYSLSDEDLSKIVLRIKDVSVGVGALVDDHAISLHVVNPQASS